MKRTLCGDIVIGYLQRFRNTPSKSLAKKIYKENDNYKLFGSEEHIRTIIRYYRRKLGDKNRKSKFYDYGESI